MIHCQSDVNERCTQPTGQGCPACGKQITLFVVWCDDCGLTGVREQCQHCEYGSYNVYPRSEVDGSESRDDSVRDVGGVPDASESDDPLRPLGT
ncbi:unnamed protein product [marine sediment metagenome]|uniref:Uncharacterized protein n=1 Tax=marine sediment metagenome TaxID=412755 RepID=X1D7U0_9ZZZZ